MRRVLLAPLGQGQPDDVQGWLEQGGSLALQRALAMAPNALRAVLNGLPRRDGRGALRLEAGQAAHIRLALGDAPDAHRLIVEQLPLWLIEGALLLARATEQRHATLHLTGATTQLEALADLCGRLTSLRLLGVESWTGVEQIDMSRDPAPDEALDGITALVLPHILWQRRDSGTTLLAAGGAVGAPGVYEVPLGLSVREFVWSWAGGATAGATLWLGGQKLTPADLAAPLTFERFGVALGSEKLWAATA